MAQIPRSPATPATKSAPGPVVSQASRAARTGRELLILVAIYIGAIGLLVGAIVFLAGE
jgi:hypothetical protein